MTEFIITGDQPMANEKKYYRDFRAHLKALEERGKLLRIKREINKDTELMPLVRWQFRGLEERDRKAFMFENVVDSKGRRYTMPVTVGTLAATTEIYAIGMMCEPDADPRTLDTGTAKSHRTGEGSNARRFTR